MARMRKPGWNACEELKIRDGKKKPSGSDSATISVKLLNTGSSTTVSETEAPTEKPNRITPLTQAARFQVPQVKADFKSKLPTLTAVEVRRSSIGVVIKKIATPIKLEPLNRFSQNLAPIVIHWRYRLPYSEAVILDLEEEGFRDTAEYLSMLFELDEEMRKEEGPGSITWKKARLKNEKKFLERLKSGLTTAEIAKRSGKLQTQAASLLDLALFFESKTWEWLWIAEQLFKSSLKVAENVKHDEGETLNIIRYLFGRFLFHKMDDPEEALNYLDEVRIASQGKGWSSSKILGVKQETLYRESCSLLHKALLSVAQHLRNQDPEMAVRAAVHALKRATDSAHNEYIAAALYELGKSQLSKGDVKLALGSLSKFLAIAKRIPDPQGVCNAHMELAFAYKELEDSEGTVKHLSLLRESAKEYKLPYKLAQAHYYTGEYLLNKSQANLATPHLELALSQFNSLGKTTEANRARCAAGISKGQEVMDQYIDLILDCQAGVTEAIRKICLWKTSRIPFWTSTKTAVPNDELPAGYFHTSNGNTSTLAEQTPVETSKLIESKEILEIS